MHYVICYDIEDDARRAKTARLLEKHGCSRVQRSVFVAPHLARRDLEALERDLRALFAAPAPSARDSVLIVPLRDEHTADIAVIGSNNILSYFEGRPLKIIL